MADDNQNKNDDQNPNNLSQEKLDLNTASLDEMASVPFMTQQRARLIYDYRQINGAYSSYEDVEKVPGIGSGISDVVRMYFDDPAQGQHRGRSGHR